MVDLKIEEWAELTLMECARKAVAPDLSGDGDFRPILLIERENQAPWLIDAGGGSINSLAQMGDLIKMLVPNLKGGKATRIGCLMMAWIVSPPPAGTPLLIRPSMDPDRKEILVVFAGTPEEVVCLKAFVNRNGDDVAPTVGESVAAEPIGPLANAIREAFQLQAKRED